MQLLLFLVILSILVLVHEWGHYITAKIFGVRVLEFGIGLPPKIKTLFHRKGTEFSLNWLPIGGFVRLYGEEYQEGDDTGVVIKDRFFDKPIWQRAGVMVAGVVMNFVLGSVLFGAVYSYLGIPTKVERVRVTEVVANSPADDKGLKVGDVVTGFTTTESLVNYIADNKGREIVLKIERGEENQEIRVVPRVDPPADQGALGVALSNTELIRYPWWQMPVRGMVVGVREAFAWGEDIALGLFRMVSGIFAGRGVPADLSGPIGIYQVSSQVTKYGLIPTMQFMGVLSINLAILNILPLPALDGGRIVFLVVEKIIGKKRKNQVEGWVHTVGMVLLLLLMALITLRDLARIFKLV